MSESMEKRMIELKSGTTDAFYEHTCGVVDEREARMLTHQILAEIRKSNAPDWVVEELTKKLECYECCRALRR
jgi:hypothetical protein